MTTSFLRQGDDYSFNERIKSLRRVSLRGPDGTDLLNALEIVPGGWVFTTAGNAALSVFGYQGLVARIAEIISETVKNTLYIPSLTLISGSEEYWTIDGAGNAWIDTRYLSSADYLPIMIPKTEKEGKEDAAPSGN